jgi:NTE family protein
MSNKNIVEPELHRALIFQGGGSLGAYEAGVFKALYEKILLNDEKNSKKDKPLFDIVAGTSIGAINAAVLVSHVVENKSWKDSSEKLDSFWYNTSTKSFVDLIPGFKECWDYSHRINPFIASGEAARRYYSTKQFELTGVSNVFLPLSPFMDTKFMDISNTWFRYDNHPLKENIEKFAKFPIATNYEENDQRQPRLLLVSVDVQEGTTVTFDSYPKKDGSRKTEYGIPKQQSSEGDLEESDEEGHAHRIQYNHGIKSDYVLASASVPVNYAYTVINDIDSKVVDNASNLDITTVPLDNTTTTNKNANKFYKNRRYFWDGGILSNTPLREVINSHQDYWVNDNVNASIPKKPVPNLEVYVVDLHPSSQNYVPLDHDGVVGRNQDISFSDRTAHDVKVSNIMADYIDMVRKLKQIAIDYKVPQKIIDDFENTAAQSQNRSKTPRYYKDLLEGQFIIKNIVKIDRKNDPHTISNKTFDFSYDTIDYLIKTGYRDTMLQNFIISS